MDMNSLFFYSEIECNKNLTLFIQYLLSVKLFSTYFITKRIQTNLLDLLIFARYKNRSNSNYM